MRTTAAAFHPMRGHVQDGMGVEFSNGGVLYVRPAGSTGWALFKEDGGQASRVADGAADLLGIVLALESVARNGAQSQSAPARR